MRFFLDNDVPVSVGRMLRRHGHTCWTAADAGLADESQDDNLSVYADGRRPRPGTGPSPVPVP